MSTTNPDWAGLRALARRLGWRRALSLGIRLTLEQARGRPFQALPRPRDDDERKSRAQIGPAILLYRALQARGMPGLKAMELCREVVLAAGVAFLAGTVGPLRQADLAALDDAGRRAFAETRGRRFFNATVRWDRVTSSEVRFVVTACRFPALCEAAGAPELAPLFCEVDEAYFGQVERRVRLERPHTLAEGGADCPFTLRWMED
jgi:hypothetical protein